MTIVNIKTVEMSFQILQAEMPQTVHGLGASRMTEGWRSWFKTLSPNASITTVRGDEVRVRHIIRTWVEGDGDPAWTCAMHAYPHRTAYCCWPCRRVMIWFWLRHVQLLVRREHCRYFLHDVGLPVEVPEPWRA